MRKTTCGWDQLHLWLLTSIGNFLAMPPPLGTMTKNTGMIQSWHLDLYNLIHIRPTCTLQQQIVCLLASEIKSSAATYQRPPVGCKRAADPCSGTAVDPAKCRPGHHEQTIKVWNPLLSSLINSEANSSSPQHYCSWGTERLRGGGHI